jgi:hypothetical protein
MPPSHQSQPKRSGAGVLASRSPAGSGCICCATLACTFTDALPGWGADAVTATAHSPGVSTGPLL